MSYLRLGENSSQVYVYMDTDGYLACHWCRLLYERSGSDGQFRAYSTQEMIGHLEEHRAAGHCVPGFDEIVRELWRDDGENFPQRPRA
jgi:hypothetical protein